MKDEKYKCLACGVITKEAAILIGKHPFAENEDIRGCPRCFSMDNFHLLCDEDGCTELHSCGGPDENGIYRMTCGEHSKIFASPHRRQH